MRCVHPISMALALPSTALATPLPQDDHILFITGHGPPTAILDSDLDLSQPDLSHTANTASLANSSSTDSTIPDTTISTRITLTTTGSIATPPTTSSVPAPTPAAQSPSTCRATNHGLVNSYTVSMSKSYNKDKCHDIKHAIQGEMGIMPIMWWSCGFDEEDDFELKFVYWFYSAKRINKGMEKAFPGVGGGKWQCPDY